jgi:hypothetical protein
MSRERGNKEKEEKEKRMFKTQPLLERCCCVSHRCVCVCVCVIKKEKEASKSVQL